jgi:hypothetical protein
MVVCHRQLVGAKPAVYVKGANGPTAADQQHTAQTRIKLNTRKGSIGAFQEQLQEQRTS